MWHLSGMALRLCVDMGLHWETDVNEDQSVLYERRRLWYSAYYFDRVLAITLGRPLGLIDESISVPLPNPWSTQSFGGLEPSDYETHHQRAHNHLFRLTQLESEIKHVQHSQTWSSKIASPRPNYKLWLNDIQPRLQEWFSTIPNIASVHPSSIFAHEAYWNVIYNNAVLLLYRPGSLRQLLPPETFSISYNAATKLISSIKSLQREGRLDVLWKAVYDLFMAGLTIIYCVWQSDSVRAQNSVSKIISNLQSCSSTLSAMSASFAGASRSRDAFDALSTATLDWLLTSSLEQTDWSRESFEQKVGDLLENMQPPGSVGSSGASELENMLSNEYFSFGEMLNSAAQWPDIGEVDFIDV